MSLLRVCLLSVWLGLTGSVVAAQDVSRGEVVVTGSRVTLRSEPRVSTETAIGVASRGDRLELADERGDWIQVRMADGRLAWLSARYCRVEPASVPETEPLPAPSPGPSDEANAEPQAPESSAAPPLSPEGAASVDLLPAGSAPGTADSAPTGVSSAEAPPVGREPGSARSRDPVPAAVAERGTAPSAEADSGWIRNPLGTAAVVALAFLALGLGFWLRNRRLHRLVPGAVPISRGDLARLLAKLEERRRQEDERLSREFTRLKTALEAGAADSDRVTGRLEELRTAIVAQQQRLDAYSDLLAAQNAKLSALEEENRVLRALLTGPRS